MSDKFEALKAAALAATPGPWELVAVPVTGNFGAIAEIAQLVNGSECQAETLYMLNANGLCPALTGTGPNSANNARYLERCPPDVVIALLAALEEREQQRQQWYESAAEICEKLKAAEQRLQQPIKLPEAMDELGYDHPQFIKGWNAYDAHSRAAIKVAGFKVEGE